MCRSRRLYGAGMRASSIRIVAVLYGPAVAVLVRVAFDPSLSMIVKLGAISLMSVIVGYVILQLWAPAVAVDEVAEHIEEPCSAVTTRLGPPSTG